MATTWKIRDVPIEERETVSCIVSLLILREQAVMYIEIHKTTPSGQTPDQQNN